MSIEVYLEHVFGEKVDIKKYSVIDKLPLFFIEEYEFYVCEIMGAKCLLMKLLKDRIASDKILKHFRKIQDLNIGKPVLLLDNLRANQRRNLLQNLIPFIETDKQIYLPFIYLDFNERIRIKKPVLEKFTPVMQVVFLYILNQNNDEVKARNILENIKISSASVNRSIQQLVEMGLIVESGNATRKKYRRIGKFDFWENGKVHLISPVNNVVYLSKLPEGIKFYYSYDSAISNLSMINEPVNVIFAVEKKDFANIDRKYILKDYDLDDSRFYTVEVWKYNPGLFSDKDNVDIFSLYAEYMEENDPRIDIELEELIRKKLCEV